MSIHRLSSLATSSSRSALLAVTMLFADQVYAQMPRNDTGAAPVQTNNTSPRTEHAEVSVDVEDLWVLAVGEGKIGELAEKHPFHLKDVEWGKFMQPVKGPVNCIDGREVIFGSGAGPHIGGGVAWIIAALRNMWEDTTLEMVSDKLRELQSDIGGHIDDEHSEKHQAVLDTTHSGTGCGALDKSKEIASFMKENWAVIAQYTKAILWDDFRENHLWDSSQITAFPKDSTQFMQTLLNRKWVQYVNLVDVVASPHTPTHGHTEYGIVLNYEPGVTFDQEAFQKAYPGKQVFWIDFWFLKRFAEIYFWNNQEKVSRFVHSVVEFHVAIAAVLTKAGTQEVVKVKPHQASTGGAIKGEASPQGRRNFIREELTWRDNRFPTK